MQTVVAVALTNLQVQEARVALDRLYEFTMGRRPFRRAAAVAGPCPLSFCLPPRLVLLDEPTSPMDSATERFVISVLRRYRQQAGSLMISHKDSLTGIADRIYILDDGASFLSPQAALQPAVNLTEPGGVMSPGSACELYPN